jgi:hypothetical protein
VGPDVESWVFARLANRNVRLAVGTPSICTGSAETVAKALAQFRAKSSFSFADCLILEAARRTGHLPLGTFDRPLGLLPGAERLK